MKNISFTKKEITFATCSVLIFLTAVILNMALYTYWGISSKIMSFALGITLGFSSMFFFFVAYLRNLEGIDEGGKVIPFFIATFLAMSAILFIIGDNCFKTHNEIVINYSCYLVFVNFGFCIFVGVLTEICSRITLNIRYKKMQEFLKPYYMED